MDRERPEQQFTLVHLGQARIFNEDVIFSVPSSQERGIDIKVGSSTMHMPKHCSEHHSVVQIVLFPIEHVSQDTFCCPHIMVPKVIRDTIEKARTFNDEITEDVIFSVVSSQEGGIDIEVGSSTMHMLKHCSKVKDVIFSVASSQEGGIDIKVGSITMHMQKHLSVHHPVVQMVLFAIKHESPDTFCCPHSMVPKAILDIIEKASVSEGAPLNSSGYGDSKMYALLAMPQSLRAGDGGSSSTGTLVGPFWLDSGSSYHYVGDDRILTNLRDPFLDSKGVTVADGSQLLVTKVGDIKTPDIEITDVYLVPGLKRCLVSVRQLAKIKIVTTFYEDKADLWLDGSWIGHAIIDDATLLYRLHFLRAPCLKEGGIGIRVGSSTMHMPKHCSVSEGAPLNSSGYGDSKMYALLALPQSLRAGDGGSSSTGTPVGPLWLDSGATHHFVGDDRILTNLRDLPAGMVITVANGSQLPVTKVGDITDKQTPDIEIKDVYLVPGLEKNLVSVRLLTKSKIVIIFYKNHANLLLQRSEIGGAIIDDAAWLYRLRFLYDV